MTCRQISGADGCFAWHRLSAMWVKRALSSHHQTAIQNTMLDKTTHPRKEIRAVITAEASVSLMRGRVYTQNSVGLCEAI